MSAVRRAAKDSAGPHRFWDGRHHHFVVKVLPGEHYVTKRHDEMIATTLGSCVSACIRDAHIGIGGMNHFMLPSSSSGGWADQQASMRYGNFAMETLINDILKAGGIRQRLEIKVFGGGNVLAQKLGIGHSNADFIERYLAEEGLVPTASHLRGNLPRKLQYFPMTGKVLMLELQTKADLADLRREVDYGATLRQQPDHGEIELF